MKRTYDNGKIRVYWDSDKCIHSGRCFGQLPAVFKPDERPWVTLDGSDAQTIRDVVESCPSGALSCEIAGIGKSGAVTITLMEQNGPYKVTGNCRLQDETGRVYDAGEAFALCSCGKTGNKPFCDGSHYALHPETADETPKTCDTGTLCQDR